MTIDVIIGNSSQANTQYKDQGVIILLELNMYNMSLIGICQNNHDKLIRCNHVGDDRVCADHKQCVYAEIFEADIPSIGLQSLSHK